MLPAGAVDQSRLFGEVKHVLLELIEDAQRILINHLAIAGCRAFALPGLDRVVERRQPCGQRFSGLNISRREQVFFTLRRQSFGAVRRDPPQEVVKLAIERHAKALHETPGGIAVIDAILERQLAMMQQGIEGAGRAFGESRQQVRLTAIVQVTQPTELIDDTDRHLLPEVGFQVVERLFNDILTIDVPADVLEEGAMPCVVGTA